MNVAELFVSLGVKGSDKTIEAFAKVYTGIKNVATMSFEAKAAIIGATYALEQFMSSSAERGTELSNLSTYLGISTKELQQWQYAAQQAGESGEEFTSSLKSVYDKVAQMRMGKQRPEGFAIFAQNVGGFDFEKAYHDIFYTLGKLQQFAKSNVDTLVQNPVLKSFGLSENTIAAMRKGVFNQGNFNRTPLYSDKEIANLNKVKVLWDNLETKVAMFFGHFTAKNGTTMVKDLSILTDKVLLLTEAFVTLLEKLQVFKLLGEATSGWTKIFEAINGKPESKDQKTLDKIFPTIEKKSSDSVENFIPSIFNGVKSSISDSVENLKNSFSESLINTKLYQNPQLEQSTDFKDILGNLFNFLPNNQPNLITPPIPYNQNTSNQTQNTTINQNLNFQHEGKEYGKIQSSVNESIVLAWKQLSAQSRAT